MGNEITEKSAVPMSESAAVMQLIERAAINPSVDIDKMERLLEMQERILARNAKASYLACLANMKPKLPVIDRRGRIEVRAKDSSGNRTGAIQQSTSYALWEDIDEAITPTLHEYGFVLTFRSGISQDGRITVTGILGHRDGHTEETTITLPHDASGSKNAVQAVGSSTSYGKRYTATLLLNIRTKGEDDDGVSGGNIKRENPHVTRPRDINEFEIRHNDNGEQIDYIPVDMHRVPRLTVAKARPVAEGLLREMRSHKEPLALIEWADEHADEFAALPEKWIGLYQGEYQSLLDSLRSKNV